MNIPERDWKHLRVVHRAALERYCERVLDECTSAAADPSRTAHERYLALFKLIRDRDDEIAAAFNGMRRSQAMTHLIAMRELGVVTEEEWAGFSSEMQEAVVRIEQLSAGA